MLRKNSIFCGTLDSAFELIRKIHLRIYPFDVCNGEHDFEIKKGVKGEKLYKVTYYVNLEEA